MLIANIALVSYIFLRGINFINRLTEQRSFFSVPAVLFMLTLTIIPGYIDWSVLTLMETGLWSFLLVMITLLLCKEEIVKRDLIWFSVYLALLVVTRPESILWGFVLVALMFARIYLQTMHVGRSFLASLGPLLVFIFSLSGLTLFRLYYFNFHFPNTYYAKVSADVGYNVISGLRYFAFCVLQSPLLALVVLAIILSATVLAVRFYRMIKSGSHIEFNYAEKVQIILIIISAVSLLVPIYVGGDHFKLLRFYQPFFPVYLFTFFNIKFWSTVADLQFKIRLTYVHSILLVILLIPFIYCLTETRLHTFIKTGSPIAWEFRLAELGREEGEKMNRMFGGFSSLPTVGVSAAGGIAYAYKGPVIDLMGLNNVEMAHANKNKVGVKNHTAFDGRVFYKQAPDIFHGYFKISRFIKDVSDTSILENNMDMTKTFAGKIYKQIFYDNQFRQRYLPVIIINHKAGLILKTYCKKEFIDKAQANGLKVIYLNRSGIPNGATAQQPVSAKTDLSEQSYE